MTTLAAEPDLKESSEPVSELFEELPPIVARGLLYLVLGLLLAAFVYSFFGRISEVVTARATAVPLGEVRQVQAAAGGKVSRVAAREGDLVERDQVLIYLETGLAESALQRAREERDARERQLEDLLARQADALQIADARARVAQARAELATAERAASASMVVAPMTGRLTRLNVHGAGETVQPGQEVAEIAPADAPLVFEARVANGDVGRVRVGQTVRLKVDAFPYHEYGAVDGTVTEISPDAVPAPDGGSYYRTEIAPQAPSARPGRDPMQLRLGLTATAEIVTARKRIVEFLIKSIRGER